MEQERIVIRNARLSFPSLFETAKFNGEDTGKYEATLLLDKEKNKKDIKKLQNEIDTLIAEQLKTKIPAEKICLKDGDESEREEYTGYYYIKAATKKRPVVLDKDKSMIVAEDDKIYSGCYVNASIGLWAQNNQFGKRINGNLFGIQFSKDGEAFGNTVNCVDDFDTIEDDDDF